MVIRALTKNEIKNIFDDKAMKVMRFSLAKSMTGHPEPKDAHQNIPYQIAKEHIEQWMVQALDVQSVGSGSYPIDIYNPRKKWGADVKMLSCKTDISGNLLNADSGETSLAQNFKDSGNNLDQQFKNKQYAEAMNSWLEIVKKKLDSIEEDYPIKNIYYFFFLRAGLSFYITVLEVNKNKLKDVLINDDRISPTSIYTKGFIDPSLGNVKLYKSKKRLELRLRPKGLQDNNNLMKVLTLNPLPPINLRELTNDIHSCEEYLKELANKYLTE
jgi:hypothetical protein